MNAATIKYSTRNRLVLLGIVILTAGLYLPFLHNPTIFDDVGLFGPIGSYADLNSIFNFRGLPYFSFGVTWVFFGENIPLFRMQSLLLHCLNILLVWRVLCLWGEMFLQDQEGQRRFTNAAYFGAAIFALHPLAVYGAGYLVQRSIMMATLFTLLMQIAYLRGLLENNKKYLILAVATYLLAVFSKEHSILAPLILLPLTWIIKSRVSLSLGTIISAWMGFLAIGLIAVLHAKGIIGSPYEPDAKSLFLQQGLPSSSGELHLLSLLTQAGLFFKYCLLMLLPNPSWMSIDMRETFLLTWKEWSNWIGLAAFLAYGILALKLLLKKGRQGLYGLALLYPWCHFLVEFSSIRVQEVFVLYRTYLWLPGYVLLVSMLLSTLPIRRMIIVGAVLIVILIPLSWNRLWVFADDYRVWDDAVRLLHEEQKSGSGRIYYGRAHASMAIKNWDAAISDYKKSLLIEPNKTEINLALSSAYYGAKKYQESLDQLDIVIAVEPDNSKAHYNKGVLYKVMGNPKSDEEIQKSCDLGAVVACATIVFSKLPMQPAKQNGK